MNLVNKFLNEGLAWISTAIGIFLACKYLLRKSIQTDCPYKSELIKINKYAKKFHIHLGILLIIIGLIHGLFSSFDVISFNMGTICWIISILLGLNWYLRKNLSKPGIWIKFHRHLTSLFILTLLLHLIEVKALDFDFKQILSNQTITNQDSINDDSVNNDLASYKLIDGVYEGIANGFGPELTVEVTVKNNKINDIVIISHNEKNERYFGPPMELIPQYIIENQSVDVDVVSGATYTSIGIMDAVKDALNKAIEK